MATYLFRNCYRCSVVNLVVERGAPACPLIRSEIVLHRACPVCQASDKDSAIETAVSDYNSTVWEERERESLDKRTESERIEMIDQSVGDSKESGRLAKNASEYAVDKMQKIECGYLLVCSAYQAAISVMAIKKDKNQAHTLI